MFRNSDNILYQNGKTFLFLAILFYVCTILSIASYFRSEGVTVPLSFWGQKELFLALSIGVALLSFLGAYLFFWIVLILHAFWCILNFPFSVKPKATFGEYVFELWFTIVRYLFFFASWPIAQSLNCFFSNDDRSLTQVFFLSLICPSVLSIIFAETKLVRADELDPDEGLGRFFKTQGVIISKLMIFGILYYLGFRLGHASKTIFCKMPPTLAVPTLFFGICWTGSYLFRSTLISVKSIQERPSLGSFFTKIIAIIFSVLLVLFSAESPWMGKTILFLFGNTPKRITFVPREGSELSNLCRTSCSGKLLFDLGDILLIKDGRKVVSIPKDSLSWWVYSED